MLHPVATAAIKSQDMHNLFIGSVAKERSRAALERIAPGHPNTRASTASHYIPYS